MQNLAIDLVNTERWAPDGTPVDRLEEEAHLRPLLRQMGVRKTPVGAELVAWRDALREWRPVVRRQFAQLERQPGRVSEAVAAEINRLMAAAPLEVRVEAPAGIVRRVVRPRTNSRAAVPAHLGLALAELLAAGEPARVKTCPNPRCRWVFYDETRGNIQRWCCASCGNTDKVRRFRERQRKRARR